MESFNFIDEEDFVPGVIEKKHFIDACNIMNTSATASTNNIKYQKPNLERFHLAIETVLKSDNEIENDHHICLFYHDQTDENKLKNMKLLTYYDPPVESDDNGYVDVTAFFDQIKNPTNICNDNSYYKNEGNVNTGNMLRYVVLTNFMKYLVNKMKAEKKIIDLEYVVKEHNEELNRIKIKKDKSKNAAIFGPNDKPINEQAILFLNKFKPLGSTNKGGKTKRRRRKRKSSKRKPVKKVKSQKRKKTVKTI